MNDYILDDDFDIVFKNGDIEIGLSDEDDVNTHLNLNKGELKFDESILIGIGINKLLGGSFNQNQISNIIKIELEADDIQVSKIEVNKDTRDVFINIGIW